MQIILSPAKTLDFETKAAVNTATQPIYLKESEKLIKELKKKGKSDLKEMMDISDDLAELNLQRFREWGTPFTKANAKQAVFAFNGDVYEGLQAGSFTKKQLEYAQEHLFILSGLHGILRPLDLIRPYRLEMGSKFEYDGKKLHKFWGDKVTAAINETGDNYLINLASMEYFKAVQKKDLKPEVITPSFKELKGDKYRVVSFYAKKARGLMAQYIIRKKLSDPEKLKDFNEDGYRFHESLSDETSWVFTR